MNQDALGKDLHTVNVPITSKRKNIVGFYIDFKTEKRIMTLFIL